MNYSSGYENNSTINIINFFDKLDENNLHVRELFIYLSNLDIFEMYEIYTFMNTIQCINFDEDIIHKMKELIKNPEFLSMKVHDIVGNQSLLMNGGGLRSNMVKMIKGGMFKQFLRRIHDGRRCYLCQQRANFVTCEGRNLGPLHKLHTQLHEEEKKHYFHEKCLQDWCNINNIITDEGYIKCPGCRRDISRDQLTMSRELCLPSARLAENRLVDDAIIYNGIVINSGRDPLGLYRVPSSDVTQDPDDPALIAVLPDRNIGSLLPNIRLPRLTPEAQTNLGRILMITILSIMFAIIISGAASLHDQPSRYGGPYRMPQQDFNLARYYEENNVPIHMRTFGGKNKKNKTRKIKKIRKNKK